MLSRAKEDHTQWNPDMIYFNNKAVTTTPGSEVQKLFSVHSGNEYVSSNVDVQHNDNAVQSRIGVSVVRDRKSGDVIVKVVNLLPVQCDMKLDLNQFISTDVEAKLITLAGNPGDKDSKIVNKSGGVTVRLPVAGACRIEAKSRTGRVESDLPTVQVVGNGDEAQGPVNGGSRPLIRIEASRDIVLSGAPAPPVDE